MQTLYSLLFDLRLMSISEKCNTVWAPLWWYYIRNFSFFLSLLYRRSKDTNFRRIVRCFAFSVKEQFMIATIVNLSFSDETSKQVSKIQKTVLKLSFKIIIILDSLTNHSDTILTLWFCDHSIAQNKKSFICIFVACAEWECTSKTFLIGYNIQ